MKKPMGEQQKDEWLRADDRHQREYRTMQLLSNGCAVLFFLLSIAGAVAVAGWLWSILGE